MLFSLLLSVAGHGTNAAATSANDSTTTLYIIAAGFAALFIYLNNNNNRNNNNLIPQMVAAPHAAAAAAAVPHAAAAAPSADIAALQESVKMLIQAQQLQQLTHNQAAADAVRNPSYLAAIPSASATSPAGAAVPFEILQDLKQLSDNVKNLERKNRELTRQLTLTEVSNVVDVEKKYRLPIPVTTEDGVSTLNLSASEIETIRAIFNMFDTEQTGMISTKELQALHKQLGEPLTADEANAAEIELDQEGTGMVTFNKFLVWWVNSHSQGKKGTAYTQRFKLMHAKLTANGFNVDNVITQHSGEIYTLEYRLNFYYKGHNQSLRPISPWHDIPLNRIGSGEQGQLFNFVCEIPKWTRAKFEAATGEQYNPIKQDTQHGKLRYYKHGDMMFNYGFFPQTWEDPEVIPADTNCPGDNDPIDCVEIGATQITVGAITAVKVLGVLGLIDDGETDWKIIAVSISDPMAHLLNDIDDVEVHLPGAIKAIREYFRDYKSFSGKINSYALRGQAMPRHYAVKVLEETHKHWESLHLVRKQHLIGESQTQANTRIVTSSPAVSSTSLLHAMNNKSLAASPRSSAATPLLKTPSLTGMEQPLDKLMDE